MARVYYMISAGWATIFVVATGTHIQGYEPVNCSESIAAFMFGWIDTGIRLVPEPSCIFRAIRYPTVPSRRTSADASRLIVGYKWSPMICSSVIQFDGRCVPNRRIGVFAKIVRACGELNIEKRMHVTRVLYCQAYADSANNIAGS